MRGEWLVRVLLLLAALDALAGGLWALLRPRDLFAFLGMAPRADAYAWELFRPGASPRDAGLWHLLGLLSLAQAGFLLAALPRPVERAGLAVAPLLGRALGLGLWLWALGAAATFPPHRVPFPERAPLAILAAREAVWLAALGAFIVMAWRRNGARGVSEGSPFPR